MKGIIFNNVKSESKVSCQNIHKYMLVWVWEVAGNQGVFACPPLPLHTRRATLPLIPKRIKAPKCWQIPWMDGGSYPPGHTIRFYKSTLRPKPSPKCQHHIDTFLTLLSMSKPESSESTLDQKVNLGRLLKQSRLL